MLNDIWYMLNDAKWYMIYDMIYDTWNEMILMIWYQSIDRIAFKNDSMQYESNIIWCNVCKITIDNYIKNIYKGKKDRTTKVIREVGKRKASLSAFAPNMDSGQSMAAMFSWPIQKRAQIKHQSRPCLKA